MKKTFILITSIIVLILSGCLPDEVKHPIIPEISEEAFKLQVNKLRESTVTVKGYHMEFPMGIGSGMIYDKVELKDNKFLYYLVTNQHVIHNSSHVDLLMSTGVIEKGDIYAFSNEPIMDDIPGNQDIAIVRFISENVYPLINIIPLTAEKETFVQISVGQTVFGIGTPIKEQNHNFMTNLAIVSDLKNDFIRHNANINPGNSGGPLFSYDGTFIGINTQRLEYLNGETVYLLNDAIDVNQVAKMIKVRLSEVKPKLGIQINDYENFVSLDYKKYYGENIEFNPYDVVPRNSYGVVVVDVNSTRGSYGIFNQYDVIQSINNNPITKQADIGDLLADIKIGNTYNFTVLRFNKTINKYVEVNLEVVISE